MPDQTFKLNGKTVTVDTDDDVRLLWVIRDLLGVTGPKYGCGINVCKACTSHYNGKAFNPCSVQVKDIKPEAVYFTEIDGHRNGILIVNIDDASRIPAMAEPFFLLFQADIRLHPVMSPDDLGKAGLEALGKKWG